MFEFIILIYKKRNPLRILGQNFGRERNKTCALPNL